jgi:hypothetical protein
MPNEDLGTALHFQLEGINLDDDGFMVKGFFLQSLKVFFDTEFFQALMMKRKAEITSIIREN